SCVNCSFISNSATGGNAVWANSGTGSPGGDGLGGAIANFGTLIGTGCLLASNAATGGAGGQGASSMQGGSGGNGGGGAVANFGAVTLSCCLLSGNSTTGGVGEPGGSGNYFPGYSGTSGGDGGP